MQYDFMPAAFYVAAAFMLGWILGWVFWRPGQVSRQEHEALHARHLKVITERAELAKTLEAFRGRSARERDTNTILRQEKAELEKRLQAQLAARALDPQAPPTRPQGLPAPKDGRPDLLQKIRGISPMMEALLNGHGIYHFDQIASWQPPEVAWMDRHLEAFKGRATRDAWVAQAAELAADLAADRAKDGAKGGKVSG